MSRGTIRLDDHHAGNGIMIETGGFPMDGIPPGRPSRLSQENGNLSADIQQRQRDAVRGDYTGFTLQPAQIACGCSVASLYAKRDAKA